MDRAKYRDASGNRSRLNRRMPYGPVFSRIAARTTEPFVGASVWASGSQVWSGHTGTFTANPMKNATNSQRPAVVDSSNCLSAVRSNVASPSWFPDCAYRYRMPTSRKAEPNIV